MKKIISILLFIVLCLYFCGCNNTANDCEHHWEYDYDGTITCSTDGTVFYKCIKCNQIKEEFESAYGCYDYDDNGYCDECNKKYNNYTNDVAYISNRSIHYEDTTKEFIFLFSLLDAYENELKINAVVDFRIENNNEIVYSSTKNIYPNDYGTWSNAYGKSWIAASIHIPISQIKEGATDSGIFYYKVYTDTANFDEFSLSIYGNLPKKDLTNNCSLKLPSLPIEIRDDSLGNSMPIKITQIDYYFEESYSGNVELVITIAGQRRDRGMLDDDNISYHCNVGYKLFDEDGYIVASGEFWTPQLAPGEKFKNVTERFFGLTPGKYILTLIDVV